MFYLFTTMSMLCFSVMETVFNFFLLCYVVLYCVFHVRRKELQQSCIYKNIISNYSYSSTLNLIILCEVYICNEVLGIFLFPNFGSCIYMAAELCLVNHTNANLPQLI